MEQKVREVNGIANFLTLILQWSFDTIDHVLVSFWAVPKSVEIFLKEWKNPLQNNNNTNKQQGMVVLSAVICTKAGKGERFLE